MASQIPVAALSSEQKAVWEKMKEEVQMNNMLRANGTLRYFGIQQQIDATLCDHHDWLGTVVGEYPPTLPKDATEMKFVHGGSRSSMAGVAYFVGQRCWLAAWDVPANKIYVKSGAKAPIDWKVIKEELDALTVTGGSIYVEPGTNVATAMSTINNGNLLIAFYG